MANGTTNGDWNRTLIGALGSVFSACAGLYLIVIVPLQGEIRDLKIGREKDGDQLARLYTSIQTNDEYKKLVSEWMIGLRRDLDKTDSRLKAISDEQSKRTTSVASVADIEKRMDRLDQHNEEMNRRSAPTIIDEVKTLRIELDSLRQRMMVPVTVK